MQKQTRHHVKGAIGSFFVDPTAMFQSSTMFMPQDNNMLLFDMQQQQPAAPLPSLSEEEQKQYNMYMAEQFYREQQAYQLAQKQQQEAFAAAEAAKQKVRESSDQYDGINFTVEQCSAHCLPSTYYYRKEVISEKEQKCLQECAKRAFLLQQRTKQTLDANMETLFENKLS